MGADEWEGHVTRGGSPQVDRVYAIMSAYAGGLAEAKFRLEETTGRPMRFDYGQNEHEFMNRVITHPGNSPWEPGRTGITFLDAITAQGHISLLITASFSGDVQGPDSAHDLASAVGRPDVLVPLCRATRQLLDLPAIWFTVKRFGEELDQTNDILAPLARDILERLFEAETANAAHDLWLARNSPLWDDLADWCKAQGTDIALF